VTLSEIFSPAGCYVQGFIVITGVAGQYYLSRIDVRAFYFWIATNIALIAATLHPGAYGQALLTAFYTLMCFYSIYQWKKKAAQVYKTWDGGHTAPYPGMTDRQLYFMEIQWNAPVRTFTSEPARAPGYNFIKASAVHQPRSFSLSRIFAVSIFSFVLVSVLLQLFVVSEFVGGILPVPHEGVWTPVASLILVK
jgi:hypothetical protein